MKRAKYVYLSLLVYLSLKVTDWAIAKFLDITITSQNLSAAWEYSLYAIQVISGDLGLGFLLGALAFSIKDLPFIGKRFLEMRSRRRDKAKDEALAQECDAVSQLLWDQSSSMERLRNENFWKVDRMNSQDVRSEWVEAKTAEAREDDRFKRSVGHSIQKLIVKLESRNIPMDLWAFSLSHHNLAAASYFFADIANSLREGSYFGKTFKLSNFR